MNLSEKNKKIVEHFYSLKQEIELKLNHKPTNLSSKQKYLYLTEASVFNYTEAIIILCEKEKFNAAKVLLRSLLEIHINIGYYTNGDVDKKLAIAQMEELNWKKSTINCFKKLITTYPNLSSNNTNNLYNESYQNKILKERDKELKLLIKKNNLIEKDIKEEPIICSECNNQTNRKACILKKDEDPSLLQKAKLCDSAKVTDANPGYYEHTYYLKYKQLCSLVHLDIFGISSFTSEREFSKYSSTEMQSEDLLIIESIGIYVALVKDLYDNKVINGDRSESIKLIDDLFSDM